MGAIPKDGALPSSIVAAAKEPIANLDLPPGYRFELGGEQEQHGRVCAKTRHPCERERVPRGSASPPLRKLSPLADVTIKTAEMAANKLSLTA